MDRRIHNVIKLSAAVFLLNACGFATKNKASTEEPQATQQNEFAIGQPPAVCYKQVSQNPELASIDENGDLFTYNSPGTSPSRSIQNNVYTDNTLVVTNDQCL